MNNIKVRTKLVIVMVIALIALALCAVISNTSLSGLGDNALDIIENDMRSSYDEQIKACLLYTSSPSLFYGISAVFIFLCSLQHDSFVWATVAEI